MGIYMLQHVTYMYVHVVMLLYDVSHALRGPTAARGHLSIARQPPLSCGSGLTRLDGLTRVSASLSAQILFLSLY